VRLWDTISTPPKPEMRAGILDAIGAPEDVDPDRPFRKAQLDAIAEALTD